MDPNIWTALWLLTITLTSPSGGGTATIEVGPYSTSVECVNAMYENATFVIEQYGPGYIINVVCASIEDGWRSDETYC